MCNIVNVCKKVCSLICSIVNKFLLGPQKCSINGGWTNYTLWLPCKDGVEKGFRYCENPEPDFDGKYCEGSNFILLNCTDDEGKD